MYFLITGSLGFAKFSSFSTLDGTYRVVTENKAAFPLELPSKVVGWDNEVHSTFQLLENDSHLILRVWIENALVFTRFIFISHKKWLEMVI